MPSFAEVVVEFRSPEAGGRQTPVVLSKDAIHYRPHFVVHSDHRIPTDDHENLGVEFVDGPAGPAPPGERVRAVVRLVYEPQASYAALVEGASFDIREGGRTVGIGVVVRRFGSHQSTAV